MSPDPGDADAGYERLASRATVCVNRARLPLLREQLRNRLMLQLSCQKVSIAT